MRLVLLATVFAALATPALAQSEASRAGLRTLSWPGKADVAATSAATQPGAPRLRGPARPAVRPHAQWTPAPRPAGAIPAQARPAAVIAQPAEQASLLSGAAPQPLAQPAPERTAAAVPTQPVQRAPLAPAQAAPAPLQRQAPAPVQQQPVMLRPGGPPVSADVAARVSRFSRPMGSTPAPVQAAPARAVVAAPAPAASALNPDRTRRYSLHREFGEEPDRPVLPAPVFLDDLPVEVVQPPKGVGDGSIDLAEPPPPTTRDRDRDERRARAASPDR